MKFSELWQRLDLLQKTLRFKIIATVAVLVVSIGTYAGIVISMNSALPEQTQSEQAAPETEAPESDRIGRDTTELLEQRLEARIAAAQQERPIEVVVAAVFVVATLFILAAIWLGLAITYLGLALLAAGIAFPMSLIPGVSGLGKLALGVIPLVFILVTMLELARLLLGASHPVFAIARNLLNEAVRMKISLVFIVILLVLLAFIPSVLNEEQPLRYRVQQWMQYGAGFGYMILALMTVFFCAASVAFEQRDKIIWQTATKPVPAWAYVGGKWVGVMILNAILLLVVSGGVFLFTKYLELQPAQGEVAYHRVVDQSVEGGIRNTSIMEDGRDSRTLDRRLLEDQVLVARVGREPLLEVIDDERLEQAVERRLAQMKSNDPSVEINEDLRSALRQDLRREAETLRRAVRLGEARIFTFAGLEEFVGSDIDFTLRYQIQAGSNDPSALYRLGFRVNGQLWPPPMGERQQAGVRQVGLKVTQLMRIPSAALSGDGLLQVEVFNFPENPQTFVFPPDGLELLYPAGGYELNFTRICTVLLIKLGFIAAVAIAMATFVSFPVAVVVTLCVLFATESAGYMAQSLESFATTTPEGNILPLQMIAKGVTEVVVWMTGPYVSLRPIESLSDGRLLGWRDLLQTVAVIGIWTVVALASGTLVFRQRELGIYSGH